MLKVHLSASSRGHEQELGEVTGDEVNKNLLFDSSREHLFITTSNKVTLMHCHWSLLFLNPFLLPDARRVPSRRSQTLLHAFLLHPSNKRLFHLLSASYLIIYSFGRLTPKHPSTLPHRVSYWFIRSLVLRRSACFSLRFYSSSVLPSSFHPPGWRSARWNGCYWVRNKLITKHFKKAICFDQVKWRSSSLFHLLIWI